MLIRTRTPRWSFRLLSFRSRIYGRRLSVRDDRFSYL